MCVMRVNIHHQTYRYTYIRSAIFEVTYILSQQNMTHYFTWFTSMTVAQEMF